MFNENDIIKYCNELKQSAVFNMSLHAKELFHSNFWAWLIDKYPDFASCFFENIDLIDLRSEMADSDLEENCDVEKVKREYKNRDLTIYTKNAIYVIENKLKSIPTKFQLEKYQEDILNERDEQLKNAYKSSKNIKRITKIYEEDFDDFSKNFLCVGLLTGLDEEEPKNVLPNEKTMKWKYLSYSKIADRMEKRLNENKKIDDFDKSIITRYVKDLKNIIAVISSYCEININKIPYWKENDKLKSIPQLLKSIRIWDLAQKIQMIKFQNFLEKDFTINNKIKDGWKFMITTGFTRGMTLIDILFEMEENGKKPKDIGIQIQGTQYRKRIFCVDKTDLEETYKKWLNEDEFEYRFQNKIIKKKFENSKPCKFGDSIKYRYWNIDSINEVEFVELKKFIEYDINFICEYII